MSLAPEPVAWERKWSVDGEVPKKERRENGRMAWPFKFKLMPVTKHKCLPDDVPLYREDSFARVIDQLREENLSLRQNAKAVFDAEERKFDKAMANFVFGKKK